MKKPALWIAIAIIVVAIIVGIMLFMLPSSSNNGGTSSISAVTYSCDGGKTIAADYATSSVVLALSDGRTLTLPQTNVGSGVRYEEGSGTNNDVVFMSEGPNAYVTENNSTTYNNCVAANLQTSSNGSSTTFTDQANTFSFDYPPQFTVTGGGPGYTQGWMQNSTSSGLLLAKLSIPSSFATGTNFAGAIFTVGTSPAPGAIRNCLSQTNGNRATTTQVMLSGTPFTEIQYGDAGAGNFYSITSYRTIRNNQCYAVEYVIHSTNIENYPSGTVSQFDQSSIENLLDGIAQSFRFL